jgi:lipopolysaccharide transport system ATP-binding protein
MAFQKKCLTKMRSAAKVDGRTVLYVSHNMNTIRQLCDRCIVLDKGRVVFEGDVDEAIEIYMSSTHNEWEEGQTEFNLRECVSRSPYTPGNAQITYLKLLDKDLSYYTDEEKIRMKIRVNTKKDYADLRLRFELRYSDDSPVGTMPSVSLGKCLENQEQEFLVEVDPVCLTSGKYRVDLVLFEIDEFGNSYDEELLLPAFFFEVQAKDDIVWNSSNWGHIRFPDATVERIQ